MRPLLGAHTVDEVPFRYSEREITVAEIAPVATPCQVPYPHRFSFNGKSVAPGGRNLIKPFLILKPRRFSFQIWSNEKDYNVLLNVSLFSVGESTVATDWRLCLLQNKEPHWYEAEGITDANREIFGNLKSLADLTEQNPIEHGRIATGWLLFRAVPQDVIGSALNGVLECRDYTQQRHTAIFTTIPDKPPQKPRVTTNKSSSAP